MNSVSKSQKLAAAAVATALATVCIILTSILPLRISLLFVSAGCYYLAFYRSGYIYGFLTIAASVLISFFIFPFSSAFILTVIFFAPYSVLAFLLKKFSYQKLKSALLRCLIMIPLAILSFFLAYWLAALISFDIVSIIGKFGIMLALAAFIIVVLVSDAMLYFFTQRVVKIVFKNA